MDFIDWALFIGYFGSVAVFTSDWFAMKLMSSRFNDWLSQYYG